MSFSVEDYSCPGGCSSRMRCARIQFLLPDRPSERIVTIRDPFAARYELWSTLEKSKRLRAVAHQHVLGLLVMIKHHFVRFSADTGFLVSAEGRVRGIGMVAIGPYASGLDAPPEPIGKIEITGPNARTQPVHRVVGNLQRLIRCVEYRHRHHGAENLLLEYPHLIVSLEHGRFDVVAAGQLAGQFVGNTAG